MCFVACRRKSLPCGPHQHRECAQVFGIQTCRKLAVQQRVLFTSHPMYVTENCSGNGWGQDSCDGHRHSRGRNKWCGDQCRAHCGQHPVASPTTSSSAPDGPYVAHSLQKQISQTADEHRHDPQRERPHIHVSFTTVDGPGRASDDRAPLTQSRQHPQAHGTSHLDGDGDRGTNHAH